MSKGLFLYEQSLLQFDEEERLRKTLPLGPRAMLHSRDVQTLSMHSDPDSSPEPVKQEEDEVPLELPINTVIVKNEFDLAKFSPLKPDRAQERSEETSEEEEESEGEDSGEEEPGCSLDLKAQSTDGHVLSLFDMEDSDDGEPPAKRTRQEEGDVDEGSADEEELTQKGVQSQLPNRNSYQFVFNNHMTKDKTQELLKEQDRSDRKLKLGKSSDAMSSKTDTPSENSQEQESSPFKIFPKERKRAPATFNGTVDKTKHQCSECHKYFQCEAHLQRHMLIHYGLKPFECPVCDKAFRYKSSYKAHLNMHTEEKPLTCSLCDKGFTQSRDLKRHMLSHTDEKNFDCQECGGKFKHKHNLIRHISVIHKAEKPYPCPMCDKAFAQKHDFMTHMRTHSGEKPFSCHICSRAFGAKGTLRTHMKVHRKRLPKELPAFHDFMSRQKDDCD